MVAPYILFNGIKSTDLHLYISSEIKHVSASRDFEFVEVPGRDGVIAFSNNRLKPIVQEIPFYLRLPYRDDLQMNEAIRKIATWLDVESFTELKKSWDADYTYQALATSDFSVEETLRRFGKLSITFTLQPYKYVKKELSVPTTYGSGVHKIPVTDYLAGDLALQVSASNHVKITLTNLDGRRSIELAYNGHFQTDIQCEKMSLVSSAPVQRKMIEPMRLTRGDNTLVIEGEGAQVTLTPRWKVRV